jgi:3D (Asp-Asp-Asp) domain-containing protein
MLNKTIYIEGVGVRTCDDTGSKITSNRVDVYFTNHREALRFGVKAADVYTYSVQVKHTKKRG